MTLWNHRTTGDFADAASWVDNYELFFVTEAETYPAEPYTTGESRGMVTDASAVLSHVIVGNLELSRAQFVQMIGQKGVDAIEQNERNELTGN